MAAEDLIVGLDIGTTKVCVIIGEFNDSGQLEIIGVGTTPSRGLRRGVVINMETTVRSIAAAVEAAEMMSGREVDSVYTGIAGGHIEGINSRGVVAVTGRGREITREDVDRVIDAAKAIVIPMDREVLHVIPQEFVVDDQGGIKNPIGMIGVRLEAEVHIITGAVTSAQNIVKCVNRAGFKVNDIVLEPLASSKAVLTQDEKELGVLLIDLGGGTTDVLLHLEGAPYHTEVLSIGGDQVTGDVSIMLKTPLESAEKLKKEAGCCYEPLVQEDEEVHIPGVGGRPPRTIMRSELVEIIQPRMAEILGMIREQIDRKGYLNILGGGVVLTGGGSLLSGTAELATEIFNLPARIGYPVKVGGLVEEYYNPIYATGVGLVLAGAARRDVDYMDTSSSEKTFSSVWDRMRNWFKEFF
ncbi:MAG: cell division protein FtsA [Spirochaetaceae bacterium]|nr:MAG: cell division protein FtsA [Spirochaetaceae bacterium]